MSGRPILTAAGMRAAEAAVIDAGTPVGVLMERAGAAVAEAAWRQSGMAPTLILCGPGNNGGDGYVAARLLRERGVPVRVAALRPPRAEAAMAAAARWDGPVETLEAARPAPRLIDALFGTGLARALEAEIEAALARLVAAAHATIAVDLPSGVSTDDGALLGAVPAFELTVALGAMKPAHRLYPAAGLCGRVAVADIGIAAASGALAELAPPALPRPGPDDHKYSRGMVAVLGGAMAGAAALAATGAIRSGAGYVLLLSQQPVAGIPHAIVQRDGDDVGDPRIGAVLVGPGLGRDGAARRRLDRAMASGRPLVIDGDALHLLGPAELRRLSALPDMAILTPHAGEFAAMFGTGAGSKVDRARDAAARAGAVIIFKGADSVVAAPDGRAVIAPPVSPWLSTAGTGDVLAGIAAAMRARGLDAFAAARAALWLHGDAARRAGPAMIADDLADHLKAAIAALS